MSFFTVRVAATISAAGRAARAGRGERREAALTHWIDAVAEGLCLTHWIDAVAEGAPSHSLD